MELGGLDLGNSRSRGIRPGTVFSKATTVTAYNTTAFKMGPFMMGNAAGKCSEYAMTEDVFRCWSHKR